MGFAIVSLLLVLVIAYFHYVQGLFSATISATCAVVAAALAFSNYERVVSALLKGRMTDQADALVLVALFAVIYIILRTVFDNLIPGNVRLPAIIDRVGGGLVGVVAGVFAIGILAIAAQTLPFGPIIGGYSRWALVDETKQVPGGRYGQMQDETSHDTIKNDTFKPDDIQGLILPIDDWTVAFVQHLSDGGSLEGDRTLTSVHPNYLSEAFYNRLGMQVGGKHTLRTVRKEAAFTVNNVYLIDKIPQVEGEISQIRNRKELKPSLDSGAGRSIVIVRVTFSPANSDTDSLIRISPASVQMNVNGQQTLAIGTAEKGMVFSNKPDDFLFVKPDAPIDLVFNVDSSLYVGKAAASQNSASGAAAPANAPGSADGTLNAGVFITIKRGARADLSGMALETNYKSPSTSGVLRKEELLKTRMPAAAPTTSTASLPITNAASAKI